jgi:reactive intermediate/imine deaminase
MNRLAVSISFILAVLLFTNSTEIHSAEIAKYDEGPFAGKGYLFSESARVGNVLFLAGQIGSDPDGKLVPGGIQAEAEQIMVNIEAALARRGLTTKNVVKCLVFMADLAEWGAFNEVYKKHFSHPYPARSALATGLAVNARVEMECIAGFPD